MRIDPDTCTDPVLLAAEVRRLQAVIDSESTLTDAEREAVAYYVGTGGPDAVDATLRGLLERTK